MTDSLLRVLDLQIDVLTDAGRLVIVDGIHLDLPPGGALGIAGESGSGKSMLCRALIGTLARYGARVNRGQIMFMGEDLARASERRWRQVRGREIGFVPQSSMAGLNPILTIRAHLQETLALAGSRHAGSPLDLLELVRIDKPVRVLSLRPHQLSGGMRQRVMIALALARRPRLLVADEPTTALDVTVQREILELLKGLRSQLGMALILVSHDLAVLGDVCDQILITYAGASMEQGAPPRLMDHPAHPYTRALRLSRIDRARPGHPLEAIRGEPLSAGAWPPGCRFAPRCPMVVERCKAGGQPPLTVIGAGVEHRSACIRWSEVPAVT